MIPYGKETEEKINRHRQMRAKKNFQTEECFTNLPKFVENMKSQKDLDKKEVVLLECMSNLVANELFDETGVNTILKNVHTNDCNYKYGTGLMSKPGGNQNEKFK